MTTRRHSTAPRAQPGIPALAGNWRFWLPWFAALFLAAGGGTALTQGAVPKTGGSDPRELVEWTTDALLAAFDRERDAIRADPTHAYGIVARILSPHVDYERITRLILGRHWHQASPQERRRFTEEFRALQIRTYAMAALDYTDVGIRYLPTRPSPRGDEARVRTQVLRQQGRPVAVDYRLHREEGRWKVYDVLVEGVSLLVSFRASMGPRIDEVGLDGVIHQLSIRNRGATGDGHR